MLEGFINQQSHATKIYLKYIYYCKLYKGILKYYKLRFMNPSPYTLCPAGHILRRRGASCGERESTRRPRRFCRRGDSGGAGGGSLSLGHRLKQWEDIRLYIVCICIHIFIYIYMCVCTLQLQTTSETRLRVDFLDPKTFSDYGIWSTRDIYLDGPRN